MSWLLGLVLGGGGKLLKAAARLWGWLLDHPAFAVCLLLALHAAAHQFIIDPGLRAVRDEALAAAVQAEAEAEAEASAHRATKQNYVDAQAQAARLEQQRLARVAALNQEISDETVRDFERRLGAARADAERLRQRARETRTGAGSAGSTMPVPADGAAAARSAGASENYRLSEPAPEAAQDDIEWRLIATEQAIQLDALISDILARAAIDPNADTQAVGQ